MAVSDQLQAPVSLNLGEYLCIPYIGFFRATEMFWMIWRTVDLMM
jgi:hypothetical protein